MPTVIPAIGTSLILPIIIYQTSNWLCLRHIVVCRSGSSPSVILRKQMTALPLRASICCISMQCIASLPFFLSVVFMASLNHWCTVLAHCELITADQTRTDSTFIGPQTSITQSKAMFPDSGKTLSWHHVIACSRSGCQTGISGFKYNILKFLC